VGTERSDRVQLALDTGATKTLINWKPIAFIGYDPAGVGTRVEVTRGSGIEFVPEVRVQQIQALVHDRFEFPHPLSHLAAECDGGWSAWARLHACAPLTVDFRTATVALE
jgi:hypothetical protein